MLYPRVVAHTDGANCPKSEFKHAGAAAVLQLFTAYGAEPYILEWGRYLGDQTNQVAELCAVELAVAVWRDKAQDAHLTIVTDSQYTQGVLTRTGPTSWKYKAKANRELIERIRAALPPPGQLDIQWVPGHEGHRYNERADRIAVWCKLACRDWTAGYYENAGVPDLPVSAK